MYGCNECTKGKIAATSSTACLDCELGKYQPLDIATTNACSDCGEGQFQDENAAIDYNCTYYLSVLILVVVGILNSASFPSFFSVDPARRRRPAH